MPNRSGLFGCNAEVKNQDIHLINTFESAAGGSEWRAITLYEILSHYCSVTLWAEGKPDPRLTNRYPIRRICHRKGDTPRRGTIVCVGSHFELGPWIGGDEVKPDRIVLVCTNTARDKFLKRLHCLQQLGREVEITYSSALVREVMGQPGRIELSPVDLQRFSPRPRSAYTRPESPIVGRLSRDVAKKHHHEDPALYMDLVTRGVVLRIMGGTCLKPRLNGVPSIELLPSCAQEASAFLASLDVFFYRTSTTMTEGFGRVVVEAMACGLPVVCEERGGYLSLLEHGRNALLFEPGENPVDLLMQLCTDRPLRERIGNAARETVTSIYSKKWREELAAFYCC